MAIVRYIGLAPCAGATVDVFLHGTLSRPSLFEDVTLAGVGTTPLANPFTADPHTGLYRFFAEQDDYDVVARTATVGGVPIDPSDRIPDAELYVVAAGVSPDRHVSLVADDEGNQIVVQEAVY